jgi:hypothetical protein
MQNERQAKMGLTNVCVCCGTVEVFLRSSIKENKRVRNMNIAIEDAEMGAVELRTAFSLIPQ